MNTLQITSSEEKRFELHINLWESEKNDIQSLDIGLFCPLEDHAYSLVIKIPEDHEINDFQDLYEQMIDNETARNVFNCYVQITPGKYCSYALRSEEGKEPSFILYPVSKDNVQNDETGLAVKVNIPSKKDLKEVEEPVFVENVNKSNQIYIRIRVNNIKSQFYSVYSEPINKSFESGYEQNEIIDFRVNDIKLLDEDTQKELITKKVSFSRVHFLLICDFEKNVIQYNGSLKSRLFEQSLWNEYLPEPLAAEQKMRYLDIVLEEARSFRTISIVPEILVMIARLLVHLSQKKEVDHTMIAYHMKTDDVTTASFLFKINCKKSSGSHLLIYVILIIIFAIVANVIWTLVWTCFQDPYVIYVGV